MPASSLFQRIGGKEAVNATVDIFYDKVLIDPLLRGFFRLTNTDDLRKKQKSFMTYAFGGMPTYSGKSMAEAHKESRDDGLNEGHFNRLLKILKETLTELQIESTLIDEVLDVVAQTKDPILYGKAGS